MKFWYKFLFFISNVFFGENNPLVILIFHWTINLNFTIVIVFFTCIITVVIIYSLEFFTSANTDRL